MISIDDFSRIDLRVGKILSVEGHPSAERLYVLKVDIKEKVIQLVAGIKQHYTEEELKGKSVIVVANLEPKQLRGVLSEGMLLAASGENTLGVLTVDRDIEPGSKVK